MKEGLFVLTAGILLMVGCQGQPSESPPIPTQAQPTLIPTAAPTPTPDRSTLASEIAIQWGDSSSEQIASLVAKVVLESPEAAKVPRLVKVQFQRVLKARVADEMGNGLTVVLSEVVYRREALFDITLLVSGTANLGLGLVDAVDVVVPIILVVDTGNRQVESMEVDVATVEITIR